MGGGALSARRGGMCFPNGGNDLLRIPNFPNIGIGARDVDGAVNGDVRTGKASIARKDIFKMLFFSDERL